jgi:predicted transcriptional regulator
VCFSDAFSHNFDNLMCNGVKYHRVFVAFSVSMAKEKKMAKKSTLGARRPGLTAEQRYALKLTEKSASVRKAAKLAGCSRGAVRYYDKVLGRGPRLTQHERHAILQKRVARFSAKTVSDVVAKKLGISARLVRKLRCELGMAVCAERKQLRRQRKVAAWKSQF